MARSTTTRLGLVTALLLWPSLVFAQRSPANGATNVSTLPTLAWSPLGPLAPKDVWFSCGTSTMVLVASQITADSWTPAVPVKANATCYWRFDVHKNSEIETGIRFSFKTAAAPPALTLSCPISFGVDTTVASVPVSFSLGTPGGGTPPYTVTSSPGSGNAFAASASPGTRTTVTQTVTDAAGGKATCSVPFVVTAVLWPKLTIAQNNIAIVAATPQTVTYIPTVTGGKAPLTTTCTPASGVTVQPNGVPVSVVCTVADSSSPSRDSAQVSFTVTVNAPVTGPTPFGGTPWPVPGAIEAENFDDGGEGVAYHDLSAGDSGGAFRGTDVDTQTTTDVGGGYLVGWTQPGEWLKYTANVMAGGAFTLNVRVASLGAGGTFHVEADGTTLASFSVPDTGGWDTWRTLPAPISLTAGPHVFRIVFDSAGSTGFIGNVNWFSVTTGTLPPPPQASIVGWAPNDASDNVTKYTVYWGTASGAYSASADVPATVTQYQFSGLVSGQTYFTAVKAFNTVYSLTFSNEVNFVAK